VGGGGENVEEIGLMVAGVVTGGSSGAAGVRQIEVGAGKGHCEGGQSQSRNDGGRWAGDQ
jgi:hypothetical protein